MSIDPSGDVTYRQEEIRDIMRDINRQTHVGEVEAITQRNQGQSNDVVSDQLLEILAGLLQLQKQDNRLLGPVTRLQKIVCLEERLMFTVRESLEHGSRVEVPNVRAAHDIQTERTKDPKVDSRVNLLHKPGSLTLAFDAAVHSQWANHLLHDKFTCEGQHHCVEGHKGDILLAFAVHGRSAGGLGGLWVREEDGTVHGIRWGRVDGVQREQEHQDEQWEEPGILEAGIGESMEEGAIAPSLGMEFAILLVGQLLFELLARTESAEFCF